MKYYSTFYGKLGILLQKIFVPAPMAGKHAKYAIATFGSHTALQILKGAKDEGFRSICICAAGRTRPYRSFDVADEIIEVEKFEDFFEIEKQLKKQNAVLIPHGSFVEFLGPENIEKISMMYYGTRGIIKWESDRTLERQWLDQAGLKQPKIFSSPEEIDRAVIVKFHGAGGGKGYFLAHSAKEFNERMANCRKEHAVDKGYVIQEYIVGVPMYTHYFYSKIREELELMSFDKRYESNADSVGRIAARDQIDVNIQTSYTITGNVPIVIRESLLPKVFEMGQRVVDVSRKLEKGGLFGPFCLEAVIDSQLTFYVFEISARIVAGTNPYTYGSPYTWLKYDVPMSTGRRIAREIREAIENDRLQEILG